MKGEYDNYLLNYPNIMIKKKRTSIIAILMTTLIFSLIPTTAFAADTPVNNPDNSCIISDNLKPVDKGRLNYIYIDKQLVAKDDQQDIVISWGDGTENISNMKLVLKNEYGREIQWNLSDNVDELYRFTNDVASENSVGLNLDSIIVTENNVTSRYSLDDMQKTPEFSITEENKVNTVSAADVVDTEEAESEEEISDSIEAAVVPYTAATFSNTPAQNQELVVVLDPGHDDIAPGAQHNGYGEEKLVLKIAKYCKEELEKYCDVKVYMTREDGSCPANIQPGHHGGKNNTACLKKRVEIAKNKNADIFISFHLNANDSSAAHGAEVFYPNRSWKPELSDEGHKVAENIVNELEKIGLRNRGTKIWNDSTGSTYPNGQIEDHLGVIRYSKYEGIPAILVEHAFITSPSDINNYLSSEAGLKKLGIADASGIAKAYGLEKLDSRYKWHVNENGERQLYENGVLVKGEKCVQGYWYYFDETTGIMKTGWHQFPNKKVYYDAKGRMLYGEQRIDGNWYYFDTETGAMATGFVQLPNKKVYYDTNGMMLYGRQKIDGKDYYFDPSTGEVVYGEKRIDGHWYYFDTSTGVMATGFVQLPNKKVYYDTNGMMLYGKQKINGNNYYFDPVTGKMATGIITHNNKTYGYDENGVQAFGEKRINGHWYYFDPETGEMATGFVQLPNKKVYYGSDGKIVYGEKRINGHWYYFDPETGEMATGFTQLPNKKVYYDADGKIVYGEKRINDHWYYFDTETGEMATGFVQLPNKKVYYDADGKIVYGEKRINGHWYYFDPETGEMATGFTQLPNKKVCYGENGHILYGEQRIDGNDYYFDPVTGEMLTDAWHNDFYYDKNGIKQTSR